MHWWCLAWSEEKSIGGICFVLISPSLVAMFCFVLSFLANVGVQDCYLLLILINQWTLVSNLFFMLNLIYASHIYQKRRRNLANNSWEMFMSSYHLISEEILVLPVLICLTLIVILINLYDSCLLIMPSSSSSVFFFFPLNVGVYDS